MKLFRLAALMIVVLLLPSESVLAQFQRGPQVTSPEVKDGKATFRLLAVNARAFV